jgi:hypothetical protein
MTMFKKFQDEFCKSLPVLIIVGILVWRHYPKPNPHRDRDKIIQEAIQRQVEQESANGFSSLIPLPQETPKGRETKSSIPTPSWAGKYSTRQLLESGSESSNP